jgi:hypothetical protein
MPNENVNNTNLVTNSSTGMPEATFGPSACTTVSPLAMTRDFFFSRLHFFPARRHLFSQSAFCFFSRNKWVETLTALFLRALMQMPLVAQGCSNSVG